MGHIRIRARHEAREKFGDGILRVKFETIMQFHRQIGILDDLTKLLGHVKRRYENTNIREEGAKQPSESDRLIDMARGLNGDAAGSGLI